MHDAMSTDNCYMVVRADATLIVCLINVQDIWQKNIVSQSHIIQVQWNSVPLDLKRGLSQS